jgi:hypothetical protein
MSTRGYNVLICQQVDKGSRKLSQLACMHICLGQGVHNQLHTVGSCWGCATRLHWGCAIRQHWERGPGLYLVFVTHLCLPVEGRSFRWLGAVGHVSDLELRESVRARCSVRWKPKIREERLELSIMGKTGTNRKQAGSQERPFQLNSRGEELHFRPYGRLRHQSCLALLPKISTNLLSV